MVSYRIVLSPSKFSMLHLFILLYSPSEPLATTDLFTVSIWFSHSVVSDSLRSRELPHARLPCLSPIPRACLNSCPSSRWCHPTISFSVIPFSSCLQSFPTSGSFSMNKFSSGGLSIGVSVSASVLPMNIQDRFPLGLTGLISLFYLFTKCYLVRIISRLVSSTKKMHLRFFHLSLFKAWQLTSFYCWIIFSYTDTSWIAHLLVEEHLGCFQIWASINKAAIKLCAGFSVYVSFQLFWVNT